MQLGQAALAGKVHENMVHVSGQLRLGCQVTDVGVQARGARVVVASRQMAVAAQLTPLAPGHQQHLGVGFQAHHAVHHLRAN